MFDGKDYADFALLWRLCHQSRVEAEEPDRCWLERWSRAAQQQGLRVLDQLRNGVEDSIAALGSGFLACPANGRLRDRLRAGQLDAQDYYRQLLRLVYRLLFLFASCSSSSPRTASCSPTRRPTRRAASGTRPTTRRPGCGGWPSGCAAPSTPTSTRP